MFVGGHCCWLIFVVGPRLSALFSVVVESSLTWCVVVVLCLARCLCCYYVYWCGCVFGEFSVIVCVCCLLFVGCLCMVFVVGDALCCWWLVGLGVFLVSVFVVAMEHWYPWFDFERVLLLCYVCCCLLLFVVS